MKAKNSKKGLFQEVMQKKNKQLCTVKVFKHRVEILIEKCTLDWSHKSIPLTTEDDDTNKLFELLMKIGLENDEKYYDNNFESKFLFQHY